MLSPTSLNEVCDAVRSLPKVRVMGGGTKPALSAGANLSMSKVSGILEYDPTEYTFTALAGTTLAEVHDVLGKDGLALPFDPPFVESGGTLGGSVAAGLSGPGRMRFGGLREFILGAKLVNGEGRVVFGGGKVVKNAAGFDIPKLMVGSLGRMGVLVELTFKVFPRPATSATVRIDFPDVAAADRAMTALAMSQAEVSCLDLEPARTLWVRVGGLPTATDNRIARVLSIAAGGEATVLKGEDDERTWSDAREFRWVPANHGLIKLPIAPSQVLEVEQLVSKLGVNFPRRYSVGGNVAWLAWPASLPASQLDELCLKLGRPSVTLSGNFDSPLRSRPPANAFEQRLFAVFDPSSKLA